MSVSVWGVDHGSDEVSKGWKPRIPKFGRGGGDGPIKGKVYDSYTHAPEGSKGLGSPKPKSKSMANDPRGPLKKKGFLTPLRVGLAAGGATVGAGGAYAYNRHEKNEVGKSWQDGKDPKTGKRPSGGRYATAHFFPGWHGAVAGRRGHKLKAAGTELLGQAGGSAVGAALTRGNPSGSWAGGAAGNIYATRVANGKGWLKGQVTE